MTVTLIKYSNRKIYSRDANRYVGHKEIVDAVKSGSIIKVLEHETDKDVTEEVLNNALVKYEPLSVNEIYGILMRRK